MDAWRRIQVGCARMNHVAKLVESEHGDGILPRLIQTTHLGKYFQCQWANYWMARCSVAKRHTIYSVVNLVNSDG